MSSNLINDVDEFLITLEEAVMGLEKVKREYVKGCTPYDVYSSQKELVITLLKDLKHDMKLNEYQGKRLCEAFFETLNTVCPAKEMIEEGLKVVVHTLDEKSNAFETQEITPEDMCEDCELLPVSQAIHYLLRENGLRIAQDFTAKIKKYNPKFKALDEELIHPYLRENRTKRMNKWIINSIRKAWITGKDIKVINECLHYYDEQQENVLGFLNEHVGS